MLAIFPLYPALAVIHTLAGAVWLGAMAYSFFLLHPRAQAYFVKDTEFEAFIATVSHGARWKVLGGLSVLGVSGACLTIIRWPGPRPEAWFALIAVKVILFLAALALFVYTSWRLWPARVLAAPEEIPRCQRMFGRVARAMITIASLGMILGVLAHTG